MWVCGRVIAQILGTAWDKLSVIIIIFVAIKVGCLYDCVVNHREDCFFQTPEYHDYHSLIWHGTDLLRLKFSCK